LAPGQATSRDAGGGRSSPGVVSVIVPHLDDYENVGV
jgi:hypothetical protein